MTGQLGSVRIRRAERHEFPVGVEVAVAAQAATGFPLGVDAATLRANLTRRQHAAAGVWLALVGDRPVGHALVAFADHTHPTWGPVTDPVVAAARQQGRLLELGGLAVHPGAHRRGVATGLQAARLAWAAERDLVAVAAAWDGSAGSRTLCARAGRVVGTDPQRPVTLYCLNR